MTRFLTQDSPIPPYMAFPRFLLDKDGLNETAKILYTILLDRARLSQKNDGWTDEQGHVFIFFPIKNLAETMHKSEMSIKTALSALEKENLIVRRRQGAGFPNRIYVKYPPEAFRKLQTSSERSRTLEGTVRLNSTLYPSPDRTISCISFDVNILINSVKY